ncbi:MAG: DUF72 domain-containing protein [Deltaproteobacteria bacterium]|nr:DUF72 domain-containing protein [Deltaproteobacteria bacterium]
MSRGILIGTSGWNYRHWRGVFYPLSLPQSRWLTFYASRFTTVELNASFYRLPGITAFTAWYEQTPGDFIWSVKASRYITHIKKLLNVEEPLERFYSAVEGFREKLGPLLIQLPPSLRFDPSRFSEFCGRLDPALRHVIEVRHQSWLSDEALSIMDDNNIALCIADTAGRYPFLIAETADFLYIRLHGSTHLYVSEYDRGELEEWARIITDFKGDVYVYFDNDFEGRAPKNAEQLRALLSPPQ